MKKTSKFNLRDVPAPRPRLRLPAVLSGYVRSPDRCGFYDAFGSVDEKRLARLIPPGEVVQRQHVALSLIIVSRQDHSSHDTVIALL